MGLDERVKRLEAECRPSGRALAITIARVGPRQVWETDEDMEPRESEPIRNPRDGRTYVLRHVRDTSDGERTDAGLVLDAAIPPTPAALAWRRERGPSR